MASLDVSDDKFRTEREVVKEERRMRFENQPFGRLPEIIFDKAFTTHPYKHQTIGSMADLEAASIADVRDFHRHLLRAQQRDGRDRRRLRLGRGAEARRSSTSAACRAAGRCRATFRASRRRQRAERFTVTEAWPLPAVVVVVPHHLRRPPGRVSAAHPGEDPVGWRQLAALSVARVREADGAGGVRRGEAHRAPQPLLRRGHRAAGAAARGGHERACSASSSA